MSKRSSWPWPICAEMTASTDLSTAEIILGLRSGRLDLHQHLAELRLRFQDVEPSIRAFVDETAQFDRLNGEANQLLERFPVPDQRPLLFGLPLGVKDIYRIDGMPTRAGSRLPPDLLGGPQAKVVSELHREGALVVGKTVTTEFAYFAPGPTRNPHNLDHTPGGSSSGSAAAVAAGLCAAALGTQTIGSVNRPAAFCGVIGFKPTYGRVSAEGVIPLSPSLDHVGFFTRGVAGMILLAEAAVPEWKSLDEVLLPQMAIPTGPYLENLSEQAVPHFERSISELLEAGYRVDEVDVMSDFAEIADRHRTILAFEAAQTHKAWFKAHGPLYHERTRDLIHSGRSIQPEVVERALRDREELKRGIAGPMEDEAIDLWITPSAPGPAPRGLDTTGNPIMNLPWTQTGLPSLTIPSGVDEQGLPLAIQLVGRADADESLLAWGAKIEEALHWVPELATTG